MGRGTRVMQVGLVQQFGACLKLRDATPAPSEHKSTRAAKTRQCLATAHRASVTYRRRASGDDSVGLT